MWQSPRSRRSLAHARVRMRRVPSEAQGAPAARHACTHRPPRLLRRRTHDTQLMTQAPSSAAAAVGAAGAAAGAALAAAGAGTGAASRASIRARMSRSTGSRSVAPASLILRTARFRKNVAASRSRWRISAGAELDWVMHASALRCAMSACWKRISSAVSLTSLSRSPRLLVSISSGLLSPTAAIRSRQRSAARSASSVGAPIWSAAQSDRDRPHSSRHRKSTSAPASRPSRAAHASSVSRAEQSVSTAAAGARGAARRRCTRHTAAHAAHSSPASWPYCCCSWKLCRVASIAAVGSSSTFLSASTRRRAATSRTASADTSIPTFADAVSETVRDI
mmetsp:Transcript_16013/g.51690  ORF Transcript_16013/g.51690 Transcript_16013/m.51690 type:complete len:336 (-) Transcript_16013:31-1038(-)